MAFVYLLGDSGHDNTYKIGVTRSGIEKRIKQLQTGNSNEIYLVDFFETKYPFFLEKWLHFTFNGNKKLNEWFELSNDDVLSFKNNCTLFENNAKSLEENPFAKKLLR